MDYYDGYGYNFYYGDYNYYEYSLNDSVYSGGGGGGGAGGWIWSIFSCCCFVCCVRFVHKKNTENAAVPQNITIHGGLTAPTQTITVSATPAP